MSGLGLVLRLLALAWRRLFPARRRPSDAHFDLAIRRILRDAAERDRRTRVALFSIAPLAKDQREQNKRGPS